MIADIISFFQDPANALVHYAMSALLILSGIILHGVRKKVVNKATAGGVVVGGNSGGIIVTGKVEGDVTQYRQETATVPDKPPVNAPKDTTTIDQTLSRLANLSAIVGLVLAALTFYLTF
ncbi:MAG: hypothetical protein AB2802_13080 [Candidatus Thiodiazotropha endolucinida]